MNSKKSYRPERSTILSSVMPFSPAESSRPQRKGLAPPGISKKIVAIFQTRPFVDLIGLNNITNLPKYLCNTSIEDGRPAFGKIRWFKYNLG
jgi:hypothetical protein